jgi:hypothetical protein
VALRRTRAGTLDWTGVPDYCVGLEARPTFWQGLYAHAAAQGLESRRSELIVLLEDGAHWTWDDARANFGGHGKMVVEILDSDHAAEHVWAVGPCPVSGGRRSGAAWAGPLLAALPDQGPEPLQAALAARAPSDAAAVAVVQRERAYFAYHADRVDDPTYRRPGLPIGSGTVDSAGKVVLKQRVSQDGMRWTARGAQALATLRAWHRSGHWAALWASRPLTPRVPPAATLCRLITIVRRTPRSPYRLTPIPPPRYNGRDPRWERETTAYVSRSIIQSGGGTGPMKPGNPAATAAEGANSCSRRPG